MGEWILDMNFSWLVIEEQLTVVSLSSTEIPDGKVSLDLSRKEGWEKVAK